MTVSQLYKEIISCKTTTHILAIVIQIIRHGTQIYVVPYKNQLCEYREKKMIISQTYNDINYCIDNHKTYALNKSNEKK